MNRIWLEKVFAALVVGLIIWPVPHYFVTQHIHSDPWKNFGLAMYATYYQVGVDVRMKTPDGLWRELLESPETDALINEFGEHRRTRGSWLRPDALAKDLGMGAGLLEMNIRVSTQQLDGAQGKLRVVDLEVYDYP